MRTSNPALKEFLKPQTILTPAAATMTFGGTILAAGVLTGLTTASAAVTWGWLRGAADPGATFGAGIGSMLIGLVLGLVIAFAPRTAPFISPLYALAEGVFVGAISVIVPQQFNVGEGVVIQAMMLTFGILFALLAAFSIGMIRIGATAMKVIVVATAGVAVYYIGAMLMGLLGWPILQLGWEGGLWGIAFSAFVVVLASLNLVLDFQYIEAGVMNRSPKYMEWYGAWGLLVTLIWLYIETLRLLAKIQSRD